MKGGCDPGVTGAITLLADDLSFLGMVDMPTMLLGKNKHQVNAAELAKILNSWLNRFGKFPMYLELVHTMPGQGVTSSGNFMESVGVVKGVCAALEIPIILITPQRWKKAAGLINKPKEAARTLAQLYYPGLDLSLKKHVGRADALLIARFGFLC
jgi:crossover junction endodeoxyribonuclease RuvC